MLVHPTRFGSTLLFADPNGQFQDTQRYAGNRPFSVFVGQTMTLANLSTGQQYSFTVSYFGQATGSNQRQAARSRPCPCGSEVTCARANEANTRKTRPHAVM